MENPEGRRRRNTNNITQLALTTLHLAEVVGTQFSEAEPVRDGQLVRFKVRLVPKVSRHERLAPPRASQIHLELK